MQLVFCALSMPRTGCSLRMWAIGLFDYKSRVRRSHRSPSITQASAATSSAMPAHCQGATVSPSTSMPADKPTTGTPRLNGATRLAGCRLSRPVVAYALWTVAAQPKKATANQDTGPACSQRNCCSGASSSQLAATNGSTGNRLLHTTKPTAS